MGSNDPAHTAFKVQQNISSTYPDSCYRIYYKCRCIKRAEVLCIRLARSLSIPLYNISAAGHYPYWALTPIV